MKNKTGPILIAGAGCAGLSLATHLLDIPGFERNITIVDPRFRKDYINDRTWSGFGTETHRFNSLISKKWNSWKCLSSEGSAKSHSVRHPYESIRAGDFYDHCFQKLENEPRVRLINGARVANSNGSEFAIVDNLSNTSETIRPSHTFDSRTPPPEHFIGRPHDILLWQQFVGLEVVTEEDRFEDGVVTLMDFRVDQRGKIRFIYVLPYSRRHALIEATVFTKTLEPEGELRVDVETSLRNDYGLNEWQVERSESGRIPMSTAEIPVDPNPYITPIGILGGLARPSTGYAFAAIQKHSRQIAKSIEIGELPKANKVQHVTKILDRIFLSYLAKFPERAPELFLQIGNRTDPDRFARFMMDTGSQADTMSVIMSMPKISFIAEAWRSRNIWWPGNSKGQIFEQFPVKSALRS